MGWFLITLIWMTAVTACLDAPGLHDGEESYDINKPSMAAVKQDVGGVVTAEISAAAGRPQQINASPSSAITGAAVLFASGSLPASTSVTIQQGEPIPLPTLALTLGLDRGNKLADATLAVVVTADPTMDAEVPFAIALPIITDSIGLLLDDGDLSKLVIIYIALDATNNQSRIGLIPSADLAIVSGRVQFKTKHFGLYQGVFAAKPLPDRIDQPTKKSILTSKIAATLPGVNWQPILASHSNGLLQVSTVVNGLVSLEECLVEVVTDRGSWSTYTAAIGSATTGSVAMTLPAPGSYLARLICTEENGRAVTSPWSKPFAPNNASLPTPSPSPSVVTPSTVQANIVTSAALSNRQQSAALFSSTGRSPSTPFLTATNSLGATLVVFTGADRDGAAGTYAAVTAAVTTDKGNRQLAIPRRIGDQSAMDTIAAAIDNSGNALVLWPHQDLVGGSYLSGSYFDALAPEDAAWVNVNLVNNSPSETTSPSVKMTSHAAVATSSDGYFRAIWVEKGSETEAILYARVFDQTNKVWVGDAVAVHSEILDLSTPPLIRIDNFGNTSVLSSTIASDSHTLRLDCSTRVDYSSASSRPNWVSYSIAQSLPSTVIDSLNWAMNPSTGQSFIVWWDSVTGFKARSFIRGQLQGIATLPTNNQIKDGQIPLTTIQVGVDHLGNAVFAWRAQDGVYASYLTRGATLASEAVLISTLDLDELLLSTDANSGNSLLVGVQHLNSRVDVYTMQRQSDNASWGAIGTLNRLLPLKDQTIMLSKGGLSVTASKGFNLVWASDENSSFNLIQLR